MNNNYQTSDLGCAAALISLGFDLNYLNKTNLKKVEFIFTNKKEIEKRADDYFSDKLKVNPRAYFDNLKMLKNRIYSSL